MDDCGDGSDEEACVNNFACTSPKRLISYNQKCDGNIDCADYSDECNEDCGKQIISKDFLKTFSWVLHGCAAVILNSIKLFGNCKVLVKQKFTSALNNKALTTVINVGDLVTGLYLLTIAIVDSYIYGTLYCKNRQKWLSSLGCAFLGVFSTFGAQMSLFSMTCLSVFRALGIIKVQKITSKSAGTKMITIILIMVVLSLSWACIPLIASFKDYFVNGMTYDPKVHTFAPFVTKDEHVSIINKYYGRIMTASAVTLRWERINNLIDGMFTKQYGGIGRREIHFYGNDGVCLFKYFVSQDDPQKLYVWSNLSMNLFCFLVIFLCYAKVLLSAKRSKRGCTYQNRRSRDKDDTQKYITTIILTDFLCWFPFTIICLLHFLDLIDATSLYPVSSIVLLPINSVINPILYNNGMPWIVKFLCMKGRHYLTQFHSHFSKILHAYTTDNKRDGIESIEMASIHVMSKHQNNCCEKCGTPACKNPLKSSRIETTLSNLEGTGTTIENFVKIWRKEMRPQDHDSSRGCIIVHRMETIPEESETSDDNYTIPQSSPKLDIEVIGENNSIPSVMKNNTVLDQGSMISKGKCKISHDTKKNSRIGNEQIILEKTSATAASSAKSSQQLKDTSTSSRKFRLLQKTKSNFERGDVSVHECKSSSIKKIPKLSRETRNDTKKRT